MSPSHRALGRSMAAHLINCRCADVYLCDSDSCLIQMAHRSMPVDDVSLLRGGFIHLIKSERICSVRRASDRRPNRFQRGLERERETPCPTGVTSCPRSIFPPAVSSTLPVSEQHTLLYTLIQQDMNVQLHGDTQRRLMVK